MGSKLGLHRSRARSKDVDLCVIVTRKGGFRVSSQPQRSASNVGRGFSGNGITREASSLTTDKTTFREANAKPRRRTKTYYQLLSNLQIDSHPAPRSLVKWVGRT